EAREVAADHVVERLVAGMALDVLEQQGRALLTADQIGDGRRLEIGIDLGGDALELAQRLDPLQPEIDVARGRAAGDRAGLRRLGARLAVRRADLDAHVHLGALRVSCCRSPLFVEHDLFRKPASTFRDHAPSVVPSTHKKSPARAPGLEGECLALPGQMPDITLSSPNKWASDRSARRWSSLKLITSGKPADLRPWISILLVSMDAVRVPWVDLPSAVLVYSILRSSASTAGQ